MSDINWDDATVTVTVKIQHTATTTEQELPLTLPQFAALLFDAESKRVRREMARRARERIDALEPAPLQPEAEGKE